jgi:ABC-type transporter lipoprotein component MlaA
MQTRTRFSLALIGAVALAGCTSHAAQHRDWSDYDGPGAEHFQKEELVFWEINDGGEPTNRVIDDVKHAGAEYVVAPLAWVWRLITPKAVRTGLTNVGRNIAYPVRLLSNAVQGDWERAGIETERFAVNTTVGILGWRDAAKDRGNEAPPSQDFGLAFRHHGWKESNYTAAPKPTVRDSVGFVPDLLADPLTYVPPAGLVRTFNDSSDRIDDYVKFTNTAYDPYRLERMARYLDRTLEETDKEFAEGMGGAVDTLQYAFVAPDDPDFASDQDTRTVRVPGTGRELRYEVWLQDERAPLLYIVPGTGGHRRADTTAALAEMGYWAGYHVVAISSALNHEFIARAGTVDFPGFAPADARDTHAVMTAIDAELRDDLGDRLSSRRAVLGLSMGGLHALYMAAAEDTAERDGLIRFDGYYALNPPVSLVHAAQGFDDYFNLPLKYFPGDQEAQHEAIRALFRHVIDVAGQDLRAGRPLPLNEPQAQFLIGIAFRMTLMDILDQTWELGRTGDFFKTPRTNRNRGAAYRELARYSFMEYLYAFVLPEQARLRSDVTNDEAGAKRLMRLCDLRSHDLELSRNPRVRVRTSRNEIILRPADLAWLKRTFGGRLTVSDDGGHLGDLWQEEVRKGISDQLSELVIRD